MKITFHKYQSLGNDFVLIDITHHSTHIPTATYIDFITERDTIKRLCDRKRGIGADGVLILQVSKDGTPEVRIFNADGSEGSNCLNGARCVMQYLHTYRSVFSPCTMIIGSQKVTSVVCNNEIQQEVSNFSYHGTKTITTHLQSFTGHLVSVGNPHFIIQEPTSIAWLNEHGQSLAYHQAFPEGINVEFVTALDHPGQATYQLLVYERGCGITQACSSGAAATAFLLSVLNTLAPGQLCSMIMPGGQLKMMVNPGQTSIKYVTLYAPAYHVFTGEVL